MEKISYKILQTSYESRARFAFVCQSVLFLSNSNEPCSKDAGTQTIIFILSLNFEVHVLTVWKNTSMLMKPKIG